MTCLTNQKSTFFINNVHFLPIYSSIFFHLNTFLNGRLVCVRAWLDFLPAGRRDHLNSARSFAVHFQQLAHLELWLLQDFHLSDVDILEWVEKGAGLFDLLANGIGDQLVHHLLQIACRDLKSRISNLFFGRWCDEIFWVLWTYLSASCHPKDILKVTGVAKKLS